MPHPINHNLAYVRTAQGERENRLHVTNAKLLIFGPEILLNSLHGWWRAAGTVPTQALRALWQGRASTEHRRSQAPSNPSKSGIRGEQMSLGKAPGGQAGD